MTDILAALRRADPECLLDEALALSILCTLILTILFIPAG